MKISNTQSSNLFLSDELLASDLDSNVNDDLFSYVSGSGIVDDVFISDLLPDMNEPLSTQNIPNDFFVTDPNLLADDVRDCTSSLSRVRTRSDFCAKERHYFDVRTAEDVQKYWCSELIINGFAFIPVCNLWLDGAITDPKTLFTSLQIGRLSRFIPV